MMMRTLIKRCTGPWLLLLGGALFASPGFSQTENDISVPEFRQAMFDYATMVDSMKGTAFAAQLQNIPDSTYAKWYHGVPNGRQFKEAVGILVARRQGRGPNVPSRNAPAMSLVPRPAADAAAQTGFAMSSSPLAGITFVQPYDVSLFTPGYPTTSMSHWLSMAHTLQGFPSYGLPSGASDTDLTTMRCDADNRSAMSVVVSVFNGVKDAADSICEIVPDETVIILGEGTTIPAKEICYGISLVVGVFNSAAEGLLSDCEEQTGDINSAEVEATWHNALAIYNLKLRLKIEQNLGNTAYPMGLFELPSSLGGYLEISRAIVNDVIGKMQAKGLNMASALSTLNTGDTYFNARNYKAAYKQYQKAYLLAVL